MKNIRWPAGLHHGHLAVPEWFPSTTENVSAVPPSPKRAKAVGSQRMYAIAFDLDTDQLAALYPNSSWRNAYADIQRTLAPHGFGRQQGSVYFGDVNVTAVSCVISVQELARTYPWFATCVRDIRMLRIEEADDLLPAITAIANET